MKVNKGHSNSPKGDMRSALVDTLCHDKQGRLHHINDGANAPWKKKGKVFTAFFQEFRGKKIGLL